MFFSGLQWTKNTKKTPYQRKTEVRRTILYQTFLVSFSKRAAFFCGIFLKSYRYKVAQILPFVALDFSAAWNVLLLVY